MSYEKYYPGGWQSGESGGTPITPEALNHIENGIKNAYSDFAPAGYGLGDMLAEKPIIADAHEIWKTGWYRVHPSVTANVPVSGVLRAEVYAYRYVTLTLYTNEHLSNDTTILRQCLVDGVWQDWEFVNPPMKPGVEYRTTERWNGKAVWTCLLNLGKLPNATSLNIAHNIAMTKCIRIAGVETNTGTTLPRIDANYSTDIYMYCSMNDISIRTTYDFSDRNASVQLWYIKD